LAVITKKKGFFQRKKQNFSLTESTKRGGEAEPRSDVRHFNYCPLCNHFRRLKAASACILPARLLKPFAVRLCVESYLFTRAFSISVKGKEGYVAATT